MLRFQNQLERLPVPTLPETCALYLHLVRPLLNETEFAATERAVSEFVQPGGRGEELQGRLRRWSQSEENWLEPFWDDWYLCDETPLVVNVSPGFALPGTNRPQVARAAGLLAAAVRFKQLVDREQLEPDRDNGAPRCMWEYSRVCTSTRIPGATRDVLEQYPGSRHVVVVRDRHFSSLDVLDGAGRAYAVEDLERALQRIVDEVGTPGPPVGVLTTDGRRAWARVRDQLLRHGSGPARELLATVETAILVLVLESGSAPAHPRASEAARLFLHGDARGRWFDKSIQLVVASNGVAGFCMEHAGFDGSTALRFAEFLAENEDSRCTESTVTLGGGVTSRQLELEPSEPLLSAIERSERSADALIGRTDLQVLDFQDFGKQTVVGHGLSPDGFVQMAFQLAYYTLTGETASTYESISTKRFLHGRTEAMRCVSSESVAFVRSLRGASDGTVTAEELLRAAVASHVATVQRCKEGRGVDRHLLGLRRMLQPDEPVPALFADPSYATLSRSVLSTSSLRSSPGVELTCFGPVVDEGFGLSYTVHDDSIIVVVTNFDGLASVFAGELERGLLEMHAVLADSSPR
jgi:carnitine O-acetyltransferase